MMALVRSKRVAAKNIVKIVPKQNNGPSLCNRTMNDGPPASSLPENTPLLFVSILTLGRK